VIWHLLHTRDAASPASSVPAGTSLFTLLGFAGLYLFIGILFLMLIVRIVAKGPDEVEVPTTSARASAGAQAQGA
jgi:cytochrome d ubiquinol oxidase subunit I